MKKVIDPKTKQLLGRTCEGCIFDTPFVNNCTTGRQQKFHERGEIKDGLIQRFCNMYRDEDWGPLKDLESVICTEDVAREESEKYFAFVIDTTKMDMKEVWALCTYIRKMDYQHSKFGVLLSGDVGTNVAALVHETNLFVQSKIAANLILHTCEATTQTKDYDVYSKCGGFSHIITFDGPTKLNPDLLRKIDGVLNDDMEKVHYILFKDLGVHCVSFDLMNGTYLKYRDFDLMLENLIEEMSESGMYMVL